MINVIRKLNVLNLFSKRYILVNAHLVLAFMVVVAFVGCSTSRGVKSETSVDGSVNQRLVLDKDAIRVKGKVLSQAKLIKDRYEYRFQVEEILAYGATFATVEPNKDEEVSLISFSGDLKKGKLITVDAFTPMSRPSGNLVLNMVSE